MSEVITIGSQNIGRAFEQAETASERKYTKEQLKSLGADVVFLAEAGDDESSEELGAFLDEEGYSIKDLARTTDRVNDVHSTAARSDIINVLAWRDKIANEAISELQLGIRTGFGVELTQGLPAVFSHFDDWTTGSRRDMADDLLAAHPAGPLIVAGDMNSADPRVDTVALRLLQSRPYRYMSKRVADWPSPEKFERSVHIIRRLGEMANDDLINYFAKHDLTSVLPPQPTFDARYAGRLGRHVQLGLDNILARDSNGEFNVVNSYVSDLDQQPDKLDHALVSATIEF